MIVKYSVKLLIEEHITYLVKSAKRRKKNPGLLLLEFLAAWGRIFNPSLFFMDMLGRIAKPPGLKFAETTPF